VNLHASGGAAMMKAGAESLRKGAEELRLPQPWLIAVTVLTSLDEDDLKQVGQMGPLGAQVQRLAQLAQECGLEGVVCSPQEIALLREACGADFKLIVPGIRPAWAAVGDQKRIMTPREALEAGADILVIGRPMTAADDPSEAVARIAEELSWRVSLQGRYLPLFAARRPDTPLRKSWKIGLAALAHTPSAASKGTLTE